MARNIPNIDAQLARELAAIERRRRAARFFPLLLAQIGAHPEAIDPVCFVGDSRQRNNRSALIAWIVCQFEDPDFQTQAEHQPEDVLLLDRLTTEISNRAAANDLYWDC